MKILATYLGEFYFSHSIEILKVYQTDSEDYYAEHRDGKIVKLTYLQEKRLLANETIEL